MLLVRARLWNRIPDDVRARINDCYKSLVLGIELNMFPFTTLCCGTAASLLATVLTVASAKAYDPIGVWHTERRLAQVLISKCAEDFCGTIVALKDPIDPATGRPQTDTENEDPAKRNRPVIGIQVVIGMKPNGVNRWSGRLYNAEDGKTYSGNLMMDNPNILKVQGCIMAGLLCQTQSWVRKQ